ncbi:peptidoglycan D,D-transpeptidase FtsI family protein [Anaerostipes rhamnosivorans]|uniref:peptidoglycan D,D-transpeptidase FtsI family protein n=1 Tax=Anaerostipes rhamnosivorans TaxID=1229621 RepID=UPI001FAAF511|nr:penicillin-binding transpeptidase domain-containing protein [Anaerostipes rhamnosivorans]
MKIFKRRKNAETETPKKSPSQKTERKQGKKKKHANRQILQITYIFVGLFLVLIGYIIHFVVRDSQSVITDSHNLRLQELEKHVVRGKIISANGKVLAQTVNDGEDEVRDYPYGRMFAHVVGYNAKGKSGLESKCNFDLLKSNANLLSQIESNLKGEKSIGDNVYTTLDTRVQKAAYNALSGEKGAVVAMDPESGKVIAMVSKPDFRPALVKENWEELNTDSDALLINRATQGLYPPGSTFKVITALEYMRENKDYKNFSYHCTGYTKINNVKIRCYGGTAHGTVNLEQAVEKSCNTAFVHMASKLNKGKLASLAEDMMYNSKIPINLAAVSSRFSFDGSSKDSQVPQIAIGQGTTLVTPLQNAAVMSAIANDGVMMEPYLVDKVKNVDGGIIKETKAKEIASPLSAKECKTLKKMLRKVVTNGTGTAAYSSRYKVYGKTGSAEYNSDKDSHAWFIGCAEHNGKKIVVSIIVEGGGSGGSVAAPIAKDVFDAYFR